MDVTEALLGWIMGCLLLVGVLLACPLERAAGD